MFLALTFPLILISTELFSCLPHPCDLHSIFTRILTVRIYELNLNKCYLLWQINVSTTAVTTVREFWTHKTYENRMSVQKEHLEYAKEDYVIPLTYIRLRKE